MSEIPKKTTNQVSLVLWPIDISEKPFLWKSAFWIMQKNLLVYGLGPKAWLKDSYCVEAYHHVYYLPWIDLSVLS